MFCFKCRTKREIKELEHTTVQGKPVTKATCPICRTKLMSMGRSNP